MCRLGRAPPRHKYKYRYSYLCAVSGGHPRERHHSVRGMEYTMRSFSLREDKEGLERYTSYFLTPGRRCLYFILYYYTLLLYIILHTFSLGEDVVEEGLELISLEDLAMYNVISSAK